MPKIDPSPVHFLVAPPTYGGIEVGESGRHSAPTLTVL